MAGNGGFEVTVSKKDVVSAALPVQEFWLPLTNLDLMLPPVEFCVFFCYNRKNFPVGDSSFGSMVFLLKKALAETLVSYYAFAGEVTNNNFGEPELLCNNNGVEFFEAYADIELQDLDLYKLEDSIYWLVPDKKQGVLAVQATELKCGSVIVSCIVDHRVADAYSANLFFVSWAETARSKPISVVPSFRRSLLSPRHPLKFDASMDELYMPLSSLSPPKQNPEADREGQFLSRVFYIKSDKIKELQSLASSNGPTITKLEAFSAFLWKLMAKSAKKSGDHSTLGIVVDGRRRIAGDGGGNSVNGMGCYFGNVLTSPFRGHEASELLENPLNWVANEVHSIIETGAKKEHFLGLIDWIEAQRPNPITAKIYWADDGPAVMVSSGRRFPVIEVDFGWGPPVLGSYYFHAWGGNVGYVMPMPNPTRNGGDDWVVYMVLRKRQLDVIEEEAGHVFEPVTNEYLTNQFV